MPFVIDLGSKKPSGSSVKLENISRGFPFKSSTMGPMQRRRRIAAWRRVEHNKENERMSGTSVMCLQTSPRTSKLSREQLLETEIPDAEVGFACFGEVM